MEKVHAMSGQPSDRASSDLAASRRIEEQHVSLREMIAEIRKTISSRPDNLELIGQKLNDLQKKLETHFLEEENGGFFDQIDRKAPRLSTETSQLKDEHKVFLVQVRSLVVVAESCEGTDEWWQQLKKDFRDFSKAVMHHESMENQLLQQAYNEDIGSHD